MGKKSNLKKVLRLCRNLPSIEKLIHEYHIVKGIDLIAEYGTNILPDETIIDPNKTYKVPMPVISEINHKKNIKYIYGKGGVKGTAVYIDAVINHVKNN